MIMQKPNEYYYKEYVKMFKKAQKERVKYVGKWQPGNLYYRAVEIWHQPRAKRFWVVQRGRNYEIVSIGYSYTPQEANEKYEFVSKRYI